MNRTALHLTYSITISQAEIFLLPNMPLSGNTDINWESQEIHWISEAKDFRLLKFKINLAFVYFLKKRHINFYLSCSLRISLLRPPVVPGEHQACPASGHWRFWFPLPWTLFPPHLPNGGPFPFLCKASDGASLGKPLCPTLPTSILRTALAETLQNSVYLFTASLTH